MSPRVPLCWSAWHVAAPNSLLGPTVRTRLSSSSMRPAGNLSATEGHVFVEQGRVELSQSSCGSATISLVGKGGDFSFKQELSARDAAILNTIARYLSREERNSFGRARSELLSPSTIGH